MNLKIPDDLFRAAFFFTDIVGLSKSDMSTQTQAKKIKILDKYILECDAFKSTKNGKLIQSTGDGVLIAFLNGIDEPLKLAMEVHQKLRNYNQNANEFDKIGVRIGCNIGNVFAIRDFEGTLSMWGPGAILAKRVMDLGESDHILISAEMVDSIKEITNEYDQFLHPVQDFTIKHQEKVLLYSLYGENFGNSQIPDLEMGKRKYPSNELYQLRKNVSFSKVEFNLKLKNHKENLLKIKRKYNLVNNSEAPVYKIINGITTNVPKTMDELKVKILDENENELEIENIQVASPLRKEFTIKLKDPLRKEQKRHYNVIYEVEEPKPIFEHIFLVNSEKFSLTFTYPSGDKINSIKFYHISSQDREKKLIAQDPNTKRGLFTQITWNLENGVKEKDIVRAEW